MEKAVLEYHKPEDRHKFPSQPWLMPAKISEHAEVKHRHIFFIEEE